MLVRPSSSKPSGTIIIKKHGLFTHFMLNFDLCYNILLQKFYLFSNFIEINKRFVLKCFLCYEVFLKFNFLVLCYSRVCVELMFFCVKIKANCVIIVHPKNLTLY